MKLKVALLTTALSVAAFNVANAKLIEIGPALDTVSITIGDHTYTKTFTEEKRKDESLFRTIEFDFDRRKVPDTFKDFFKSFKSGTVFLTEPANQAESDGILKGLKLGKKPILNLSDAFTIQKSSDGDEFEFKISFVSDGASKDAIEDFPIVKKNFAFFEETGALQDISRVFGEKIPSGTVFIQSDDPPLTSGVPELSTWAMMLIGFAGIGLFASRRNRKFSDPLLVS